MLSSHPKQPIMRLRTGEWLTKATRVGTKKRRFVSLGENDTRIEWKSKTGTQRFFRLLSSDGKPLATLVPSQRCLLPHPLPLGLQMRLRFPEAPFPFARAARARSASRSCISPGAGWGASSLSSPIDGSSPSTSPLSPQKSNGAPLIPPFASTEERVNGCIVLACRALGLDMLLGMRRRSVCNSVQPSPSDANVNAASTGSVNNDLVHIGAEAGVESPGVLYVWGRDAYLGRDEESQDVRWRDSWRPSRLDGSIALDIGEASVGQGFGAIVEREFSSVYVWGKCSNGISGSGVNVPLAPLMEVPSLTGRGAISVRCGASHVVVLSEKGQVWTWGATGRSPPTIACGDTAVQWFPRLVPGLFGSVSISQIACGGWHTLALSSDGSVFSWGEGFFGPLGHGTTSSAVRSFLLASRG